jgi:hypothetical protein
VGLVSVSVRPFVPLLEFCHPVLGENTVPKTVYPVFSFGVNLTPKERNPLDYLKTREKSNKREIHE